MPPSGFRPLRDEPSWPQAPSEREEPCRIVFLLDASSALERRLLMAWIERQKPEPGSDGAHESIEIPPTRRRRRVSLAPLEARLSAERELLLAPLRVAWLPPARDGERTARLTDLLHLGDPHDPRRPRQRLILLRDPDRCRIVAGEPATAAELRERWQRASGTDVGQTTGFAEFVARQAVLALERSERRLRGARYKVPRLVHEDILGRASFRGGLSQLARQVGVSEARAERDANRYLREIAATHSPFVIDLVAHLIHLLYTRGYDERLHYDAERLAGVEALTQRHPVVFLPSHKSNLDHLVLQYMLHENGHPPNHTAGGINMNFFPVGPLVRRSGVFFIRRTFKDNAIYKFVLHHYVDYLIEKRFSLEWYIEGGRSRSGKLLPPRFGLLAYVVDAYRRGKSDDVMIVPVSIAYDQIQDVRDYAAEQSGAEKQKESFGWFLGMIRRLGRRYGNIHISFGEPLSLAKAMGPPDPSAHPDPDEQNLAIQKLAFEVSVRINAVTPVTATSLVAMSLLGMGDQAETLAEIRRQLENLLLDVKRRNLPTAGDLDLESDEGVERALEALVANGVVARFAEGEETVYSIGPDQQLAAAYYRNSIIHFFLNPAIAELALLRAAEDDVTDRVGAFWSAAMELRDLLKFEFFFSEKEIFRGELRRELADRDPDWERLVAESPAEGLALLRRFRPFNAHRVIRPFVDAYRIVADHLERKGDEPISDERRFVSECVGLGRQYLLQRRIRSAASISQVLFTSALRLADNRGLVSGSGPELGAGRRDFAEEVRASLRRTEAVDALAASRRAGLID